MRLKLLFLLSNIVLTSCQQVEEETPEQEDTITLDYEDFLDIHLEWKNLFSPAKSQYFVYIYSISCGHCNQIKKEVLEFVNDHKEAFYLIEFNSDIPTKTNVAESIGKEKIEEVSILGTPTLIGVTNWAISLDIAGEKEITDYLSSLPHSGIC